MSDKSLMTVEPREVTSYAARIRELMPGGNRLAVVEAQSLAQGCLLHGLDPFNGEMWFLKDKSGNPIGLMAGIKGHRRAAHRQLDREGGGNFWCEFDQLTPEEKKAMTIPDPALAFRCRLYDSISLRLYTEQIERLMKSGVPWESVKALVGERPTTVGYGFFTPGELTRMKPAACAMKRSEADALKRRFDLPFGSAVGAPQDQDVSEGEYQVTKPEPAQPSNGRSAGSQALYGEPDIEPTPETESEPPQPARPEALSPDAIRSKVAGLVSARQGQSCNEKQVGLALRMIEACFNSDDSDLRAEMRHRVLRYLFNVASSKDLAGHHHLAILDWLKPAKGGDGKYQPSEAGILECRIVEHAALLAEGQGELFPPDPVVQAALDLGGEIVEGEA